MENNQQKEINPERFLCISINIFWMKIGWGKRALYTKIFSFSCERKSESKKQTIARFFFIFFTAVNKKYGILCFTNSDNKIKLKEMCRYRSNGFIFDEFFQSTPIKYKMYLVRLFHYIISFHLAARCRMVNIPILLCFFGKPKTKER